MDEEEEEEPLPTVVSNLLMGAGQNVRQYMDKVDDEEGLKELVTVLVDASSLAQLKECILSDDSDKEEIFYYKLPRSKRQDEGTKKLKIGTFLGGVLSQIKWMAVAEE